MRKLLLLIPLGVLAGALVLTSQSLALRKPPLLFQHTNGRMTTKATPAAVRSGGSVQLSLTVTGPVEYQQCRPVTFWADDASGRRAWTEVQNWMCPTYTGPGHIAAGQSMTFPFSWPTRTLAPGVYTVHGWFGPGPATDSGNIPTVTVEIEK